MLNNNNYLNSFVNSTSFICAQGHIEKLPIVKTKNGDLRGKLSVDHYGKHYYSFQGIPYAQPPVGDLRFKTPREPKSWSGIKDATKEGNICYSRHMMYANIMGAEDCLFLNVYTPIPSSKSLKPVMVWIHGGGYLMGSGNNDFFSPDFLIHEDIVIVTINYRLGLLGFLSLNDSTLDVPGNAGLKDQVMALKWIKSNIINFGGDPNNVTIFGESAGGASVHYLMLSKMGKGLFHKAIIQSGSALANRGRGQRSTPLLEKALKLTNPTEKKIFKILQAMSVEQLFDLQEKIPEVVSEFRTFGAVVEPYVNNATFLSKEPIDIIKSKDYYDVPMILGFTSREGYFANIMYGVDHSNGDFEKEIITSLNTIRGTELSKKVANRIKTFFYGNNTLPLSNTAAFTLLQGDNMFIRPVFNTARIHAATSKSPVYLYRMSIDSELNLYKKFYKVSGSGVCHADDLGYLFKNELTPEILPGSVEENGIKVFTKLWATFAKTGNPNPIEKTPFINVRWKPIAKDVMNYVDIGENLTVGINPDSSRMEFWQEIEDLCGVSYS
ncbi:hypothetical protein FQR65_LT03964 [Abscondita terminalis]|nr:hypothetical protein FQR65_LT03964 [Abscondita terminalis]